MSLEGPPHAFPQRSTQPRSKAQTPQSISDGSSSSAHGANGATRATTALSNERTEFEAAVRPVLPRLFRFCLGLTGHSDQADDLFQNTLIKAYLNASSFEGRSDLGGWLCGIAWHVHLEVQRTKARRKGLFAQFVDACSAALGFGSGRAEIVTPETRMVEGQNHENLLRCLQTLPKEFQAVVILCDIEEIGYDRAAEILGIPKGTVKSRHARGRVRLREAYEKLGFGAKGTESDPKPQMFNQDVKTLAKKTNPR